MIRDYREGVSSNANLFVGVEVENTKAKNLLTLFVVDFNHDPKYLLEVTEKEGCKNIYLGANHSLTEHNLQDCLSLVSNLVNKGLYVTIDFDYSLYNTIQKRNFQNYSDVILILSVKLAHIKTCTPYIKIDDVTFDYSNPGVWVLSPDYYLNAQNFTSWMSYKDDYILK